MLNLLGHTDRCVKCGLCLPHCPTYGKTQNEGESPRGRIALIEGLANGKLALTPRLEAHLDSCLACRACENVCPSEVQYGTIIDAGRALVAAHRPPRTHEKVLNILITRKPLLRLGARLLRFYQHSGLRSLVRGSGLLKLTGMTRLDALLPPILPVHTLREYYSPLGVDKRGDVALFTGCVASVIDTETLNAAIRLLTACGYGVHVPRAQGCCGALHMHSGAVQQVHALAMQNVDAFIGLKIDAIISTASGCGAPLAEYYKMDENDGRLKKISEKVRDISEFLASIPWPENVTFAPLEQRVAVHESCSLRHVLHQHTHPYTLLRKIPGIDVVALPGNAQCCGAAGTYMITQPVMADALRKDKLTALKGSDARLLVTSNVGCALHIAAGLRPHIAVGPGQEIEVIHPVTLLARQLRTTEAEAEA